MKFRALFFSILAGLSLLWCVCGTVYAVISPAANPKILATATLDRTLEPTFAAQMQSASNTGQSLGIGAGVTVFAAIFVCTGLPLLLIFGLLAWRNNVGMKHEREHAELIEATKGQSTGGRNSPL